MAHQTKYSEHFRSQENYRLFFTSNFEWPIRQNTLNSSVHKKTTGFSRQVISSGPSDNVQGTLPFTRKQQGFLFFTSSSNGNHTNHKRYSDPIRPQENNSVFFTSNSNGVYAHQTKYSEPFRSLENNRVFFTSNSSDFHAH